VSWGKGFAVFALVAALGRGAGADTPAKDGGPSADDAEARRERIRRILETMPPPSRDDLGRADHSAFVPLYEQKRAELRAKRGDLADQIAAEKALPRPDRKKLATLRRADAKLAAEEARYTRALVTEQRREEKRRAEERKAFEGVKGIGVGSEELSGVLH
jgi:hypothetical protein